jgi:hypothetical protein
MILLHQLMLLYKFCLLVCWSSINSYATRQILMKTSQCLTFMHIIKDLCVLDLFLKLEQNENILTHAEECCASVYDDCVQV